MLTWSSEFFQLQQAKTPLAFLVSLNNLFLLDRQVNRQTSLSPEGNDVLELRAPVSHLTHCRALTETTDRLQIDSKSKKQD